MTDPLSIRIPLAGVDTNLPLLPDSKYALQVVESTIDPNKDTTGLNWNLKLATLAEHTSITGTQIKPNFPLYMTVALQPAADSKDPQGFLRGLGEAVDAIFGTTQDNRPEFSKDLADQAVGKQVVGGVYTNEWQGKKSNKIRRLEKVAA